MTIVRARGRLRIRLLACEGSMLCYWLHWRAAEWEADLRWRGRRIRLQGIFWSCCMGRPRARPGKATSKENQGKGGRARPQALSSSCGREAMQTSLILYAEHELVMRRRLRRG